MGSTIYTLPEYRNMGLGKKLLDYIEQHAIKNNFTKVYLYTFTAESFYKRNNYIKTKEVTYKNHATSVMEKSLGD